MKSSFEVQKILNSNGIGVLATDTLYGLVGRAMDKSVVERIYKLKSRQYNKPFIILINELADLGQLEIEIDNNTKEYLAKVWPGPVSVILPCKSNTFEYLHRGTFSLAVRQPNKPTLRKLIAKTGPLVAPSANPEGMSPAMTIRQAKDYFGDSVDFYQSGRTINQPSKLIKVTGSTISVLRS